MKSGRRDPRQLSLEDGFWEIPRAPRLVSGSLAYGEELCGVLAQALKETPLSRSEIAARMSDLAAADISEATLNAWTARSKDRHRFPFEFAAAFNQRLNSWDVGSVMDMSVRRAPCPRCTFPPCDRAALRRALLVAPRAAACLIGRAARLRVATCAWRAYRTCFSAPPP